ncbi:MAG: hypothetical protein O3B24_06940 [Verrucomicrobia bacterium]|nr:hypothetical protein [Verrucomicrobiota bacterium]
MERNHGEQPFALVMRKFNLKPHEIVVAASVPITHKLIARACKGRWLTPHSRDLVCDALNRATGKVHTLGELFNYQ